MRAALSLATRAVLAQEWRSTVRGVVDMAGPATPARPGRIGAALIVMAAIVVGLSHLLLQRAGALDPADPLVRITLTINLAFLFVLMLSAALDSAAYALYAKGDYDLLFSAPLPPRVVLLVRALNVFGLTLAKAMLYAAPMLLLLAVQQGPHWLAGLPLLSVFALAATAIAIAFSLGMVRLFGVRRTRALAQIFAALSGLLVLVMVQWEAIFGAGPKQALVAASVAGGDAGFWRLALLPAAALTGDAAALAMLALGATALAALIFHGLAEPFVRYAVLAAGGAAVAPARPRRSRASFGASPFSALMLKERRIILRDPWLMSQVLMQCIFLIPIAIVTIYRVATGADGAHALAPVLIVLVGQIAGGLTWIALSADDAGELAMTAPLDPGKRQRARRAAIAWLALVFAAPPLILLLAIDPVVGLVSLFGAALAIVCAVAVNLWHQPRPARAGLIRRRGRSPLSVTIMELTALTVVAVAAWPLLHGDVASAGIGAMGLGVTMAALFLARRREA
jgi:ABC-2 type transport system permease protein